MTLEEILQEAEDYARSDNSSMLYENFHRRYTSRLKALLEEHIAQEKLDSYNNGFSDASDLMYMNRI